MLQRALTQARQHEDTDNEHRICDSEELPSLAIDATRMHKGKLASVDKPGNLRSSSGRASHSECPAHRTSCNFCAKSGHFEVVCMKKKGGGKLKQKPSTSSVELQGPSTKYEVH